MIITTLNSEEEEVVLQRFRKNARMQCREQMEKLVECTRKRTFSLMWECKEQNSTLHKCLAPYTTDEIHLKERHAEIDKKTAYLKKKGLYPPETPPVE